MNSYISHLRNLISFTCLLQSDHDSKEMKTIGFLERSASKSDAILKTDASPTTAAASSDPESDDKVFEASPNTDHDPDHSMNGPSPVQGVTNNTSFVSKCSPPVARRSNSIEYTPQRNPSPINITEDNVESASDNSMMEVQSPEKHISKLNVSHDPEQDSGFVAKRSDSPNYDNAEESLNSTNSHPDSESDTYAPDSPQERLNHSTSGRSSGLTSGSPPRKRSADDVIPSTPVGTNNLKRRKSVCVPLTPKVLLESPASSVESSPDVVREEIVFSPHPTRPLVSVTANDGSPGEIYHL